MHPEMFRWMSPRRLARLSGVSEARIGRFVREGMPAISDGKATRVRYADLERHVAERGRRAAIVPASDRDFILGLLG